MKPHGTTMRRIVPALVLLIGSAATITLAGPRRQAGVRADLDGVWFAGSMGRVENLQLTAAGQAALDRYDHLRDDPAMRCIPASFTRVMHTPSPPIEVRQHTDHVEINYEFLDLRRRVPLSSGMRVEDAPYTVAEHPRLGRSVGHYEGETLVIETAGQEAGVLDTVAVQGLPQSGEMRTIERFVPDGDRMQVVVTHHDAVNYVEPLLVTFTYYRLDGEILEWGCVPEESGYDRFEELPEAN